MQIYNNTQVSAGRLLNTDNVKMFVKNVYLPSITNIEYLELIKKNGFINLLKKIGVYKQTGARKTKKTYLDDDLSYFIKIENNAKEYSKMIFKLMAKSDNVDVLFYDGGIESHTASSGEKVYLKYLETIIKDIVVIKYQYPILSYRIDLYIPELKIAIEYNEKHHYSKTNLLNDEKRIKEIEYNLGCRFYIIDERKNIIDQIETIAEQIVKEKTGISPSINGKYITESCQDILLEFIKDFDLYFKNRNLIIFGKENVLNVTHLEKHKLSVFEEKLAFAIDMGYIGSFDMLLQELRKIWQNRNKYILD